MIAIISPAKTLDFETKAPVEKTSKPFFYEKANKLSKVLSNFSIEELEDLMNISYELAELNYSRFKLWSNKPDESNTKQALLAFTGEVFRGINAYSFNADDFEFAQKHVRILSGLYGVLRPLDGIQAYRLEMGTKLKYQNFDDLYSFWGNEITQQINKEHSKGDYVINLASNEYFKSINKKILKGTVITPIFKDYNKGELKVVTVYAKNARGQMIQHMVKNKITEPEQLKLFDSNGYEYSHNHSDRWNWVFVR